jgi:hypothetical protein
MPFVREKTFYSIQYTVYSYTSLKNVSSLLLETSKSLVKTVIVHGVRLNGTKLASRCLFLDTVFKGTVSRNGG